MYNSEEPDFHASHSKVALASESRDVNSMTIESWTYQESSILSTSVTLIVPERIPWFSKLARMLTDSPNSGTSGSIAHDFRTGTNSIISSSGTRGLSSVPSPWRLFPAKSVASNQKIIWSPSSNFLPSVGRRSSVEEKWYSVLVVPT